MNTVELIPVSQWVYDLYKVSYWVGDPDQGGRVIKTIHLASSCENHLGSDAWENAPHNADFMTYEVVKQNVGHPRVVGRLYGQDICESSRAHGLRLSREM